MKDALDAEEATEAIDGEGGKLVEKAETVVAAVAVDAAEGGVIGDPVVEEEMAED